MSRGSIAPGPAPVPAAGPAAAGVPGDRPPAAYWLICTTAAAVSVPMLLRAVSDTT